MEKIIIIIKKALDLDEEAARAIAKEFKEDLEMNLQDTLQWMMEYLSSTPSIVEEEYKLDQTDLFDQEKGSFIFDDLLDINAI